MEDKRPTTPKDEVRYLKTSVELRANDDESKKARGYAAVFNSDSHDLGGFVERIAKGAFSRSLEEAGKGEVNIYGLWQHDSHYPLGSTRSGKLKLEEDDHGLAFELDTTRFNEMMVGALEDGDLQMSFGFRVRKEEWLRIERDTHTDYERILHDVELLEISLVTHPAYPETEAGLRSLEQFKEEFRKSDNVDTSEQLKKILCLQHRVRSFGK